MSTGAIDPLDEIADICAEYGLWMHVDGAYGGVAALTDALHPLFRGIERADSVALDPHKWLYTPHSGGVIVVRDMHALANAFAIEPSYVHEDKELTGRGIDMYALGPQFSRGFHALKIWVSLLAHGWNAYERRIAHDVALARYLYELALGASGARGRRAGARAVDRLLPLRAARAARRRGRRSRISIGSTSA